MANLSWFDTNGDWISSTRVNGNTRARRVDAEYFSLSLILNLIRTEEANTRQELERSSNLGRAIVVDRLAKLLELGLIEEGDLAQSNGGRAPRYLRFNRQAGFILLASVQSTSIGIATADLSGRLLVEHHEEAEIDRGAHAFLQRLVTLFDWMLEQRSAGQPVWGIGIAFPGRVEAPAGQPFASPRFQGLPGWQDYPLVETLAARYCAPVWVRGTVPMKTLGEHRTGAGVGVQNMLYVDIAREIAAGLVSEGRLHMGANGAAGMLGHFVAQENNTLICRCGNVGCLETVANVNAIVREAMVAAKEGTSQLLAETLSTSGEIIAADVGAAAERGDAVSAELMSRVGRLVGASVAEVANVFNPSLIVLSGQLAQASDIVLATFREAVYRRSHPIVARDLSIVRSQMSGSGALVGTAISVTDEMFSTTTLSFWVPHGAPVRHPEVISQIERMRQAAGSGDNKPRPPDPWPEAAGAP